jgi:GNAT superfamily N-acetyltransferase
MVREKSETNLYRDHNYVFIDYTFVLEDYRKLGIGKRLYAYVEEWCRKNDTSEIVLDVIVTNPESMKFHESIGYKPFVKLYSKPVSKL